MKPRYRYVAATLLVLALLLNLLWVALNVGDLRDYGSFIAAGKAASVGDNPYGVYEDTYGTTYNGEEVDLPNLNPPISIYAFQALSKVDPGIGKGAVVILSVVLYAGVVAALARRYPEKRTSLVMLWAISLAGFWHTLELGQVYIPLLAAVTGAWLVQDRRPLLAGLLIGLAIAMKPNFVVWPLLLLLSGERKTSLSALAAAAGLSTLPLLFDGTTIYRHWLDASRDFAGLEMPGNSSLLAIFARAGFDEAGIAASAVLVVALAGYVRFSRPNSQQIAAAGIVGALLLGPITWSGYTLFALPVLMARPWGNWERAAAGLLAVPVPLILGFMPLGAMAAVLIGPLYGWSLLMLAGLIAADALRQRQQLRELTSPHVTDEPEALAA